MLKRENRVREILIALRRSPVVSLLGPRQCGKSTLALDVARGHHASFFDLEDKTDLLRLESPKTVLERLRGLVVIDEIQLKPELFPLLRVLADRPGKPAQFLILGSADPRLIRGVSESLAGRVSHVDLSGFDITETGPKKIETLWRRGGFPRSFLAPSEADSYAWRRNYIRDFLQRDMPAVGLSLPAAAVLRFWNMIAHYQGNVWNAAEFARSLGQSEGTARRYLDLLTGAFVVRQLAPWFQNIGKRQVKSPKVYVRDSGLLHTLLGLETHHQLLGHPKSGGSWEGFVVEQILSLLDGPEAYFWATHQGAELDLLVFLRGKRWGFEMKRSDGPTFTKSMGIALDYLKLDRIFVVYPGLVGYSLHDKAEVVAIGNLPDKLRRLR